MSANAHLHHPQLSGPLAVAEQWRLAADTEFLDKHIFTWHFVSVFNLLLTNFLIFIIHLGGYPPFRFILIELAKLWWLWPLVHYSTVINSYGTSCTLTPDTFYGLDYCPIHSSAVLVFACQPGDILSACQNILTFWAWKEEDNEGIVSHSTTVLPLYVLWLCSTKGRCALPL